MTVEEYLKSLDPAYGSEAHQRDHLEVMARAQRLNPCAKSHDGDHPPTHTVRCYPTDAHGRMVGS